jgi:hypothetical protein
VEDIKSRLRARGIANTLMIIGIIIMVVGVLLGAVLIINGVALSALMTTVDISQYITDFSKSILASGSGFILIFTGVYVVLSGVILGILFIAFRAVLVLLDHTQAKLEVVAERIGVSSYANLLKPVQPLSPSFPHALPPDETGY